MRCTEVAGQPFPDGNFFRRDIGDRGRSNTEGRAVPASTSPSVKPFILGFASAIFLIFLFWVYPKLGVCGGSGSTSPSGKYSVSVDAMLDGNGVLNFELRNETTKEITRRGTVQILNSPFTAVARGASFEWGKNEEFVDIRGTNNGFVLRLATLDNEITASQPTTSLTDDVN